MSRFYVGQRVRVRYVRKTFSADWHPGAIVTIVQKATRSPTEGSPADYVVKKAGGLLAYPLEEQLEPATDSYDKIEWSDCIWQPEHMRATVDA